MPPQHPTAQEFLQRLTAYAIEHGLEDSSMRRMASILGTSDVLLRYHFGSREGLLSALMAEVHDHYAARWRRCRSRSDAVATMWRDLTSSRGLLMMQLYFIVISDVAAKSGARRDTYIERVDHDTTSILSELGIREGLTPARAQTEALITASALRGLLLERLVTGDRSATSHAVQQIRQSLAQPQPASARAAS